MSPSIRRDLGVAFLPTIAALLIHGYHAGHEDGAIYVPALRHQLDPSLYPFDASFFLSQTRWMLFTELVAASVRFLHVSAEAGMLGWHILQIFLILYGALLLSRRLFDAPAARWGALLSLCAALHMPEGANALSVMDRHLHPRDLATGLCLLAFVALLDRHPRSLAFLAGSALIHPTMTLYNAYHMAGQILPQRAWRWLAAGCVCLFLAAFFLAAPVRNAAWHELLSTRRYLFPLRWRWYEWLGVLVPFACLVWLRRLGEQYDEPRAAEAARRILFSGLAGVAAAILLTTVPRFERLARLEPMRTLHFVYVFWILLAGGWVGRLLLRDRALRWAGYLGALALVFFLADRIPFGSSPHIEWPGTSGKNPWVAGFDWARRNTPRDALFALDPDYLDAADNGSHGFRAFAQRSMLADWVKDRAVAGLEPELAYQWRLEDSGRLRWQAFGPAEFRRLRVRFGVSWVILERARLRHSPGHLGLLCPFSNEAVYVCQIPEPPVAGDVP